MRLVGVVCDVVGWDEVRVVWAVPGGLGWYRVV